MKCITDDFAFIHKDIFPVKIILTNGNVENAENLLIEKNLQISTSEPIITKLKNNVTGKKACIVLDFGREIHGKIRILTHTTSAQSTADVRITYGESISEALSDIGHKAATNDHSTRDFTVKIPDFSDMSFNESGFRFAKIELISKNTEINLKAVTAVSIMRDVPYLGTFECSNETINKIYSTSAYTCHLNMQRYLWDGIKRDRLVWVGDMHPEMLTVRTIFGADPIIEKSLRFMRDNTPLPGWMNGMPTYSLWWLHILYDWYIYSGNSDFLEENKAYATELIEIVCNLVNLDGSDNLPSYFIDWPCNGKPAGISGSRALLAMTLDSAASLCEYYKNDSAASECRTKKELLLKTKPVTHGAKQVAAMYSLAGWLDKNEAGKEILKNSAAGFSTFMSYYLLKAASYEDMNATLNVLEEYYGGMLKMGATSFWEDFDIDWMKNACPIDEIPDKSRSDVHADNGAFCYKGLRHSLCHGWSSAPTAFLAEEVLGIKILEHGCKKIRIAPNLGNLDFAKGTYPTPYGIISVECKNVNGNTTFNYCCPDEITVITDKEY